MGGWVGGWVGGGVDFLVANLNHHQTAIDVDLFRYLCFVIYCNIHS